MAALKTFSFGDGVDHFFMAATSKKHAYELYCKVGDSRIRYHWFRERATPHWGKRMEGIEPVLGGVWTQRPDWHGSIKREL